MSQDVENQLLKHVNKSYGFCLQIDESVDITKKAQLLVYVRYEFNCQF